MNYMADGAKLNFMDECDLYTLLEMPWIML